MTDFRKNFYKSYRTSLDIKEDSGRISKYSLKCGYEFYISPIKNYNKTCRILDIGCGGGKIIELLNTFGYNNVFGIDISEEQIAYAKSKKLNVELTDVFEYLSNTKERYDVIYAIDFVEHFNTDELYRLFNLLFNILTEGGLIVIRTPNAQGLFASSVFYGDLTHQTFFTYSSFCQLINNVGLRVAGCKEDGPIKNHLLGFPRYITWGAIKFLLNLVRRISGAQKIKYWTDNVYYFISKD